MSTSHAWVTPVRRQRLDRFVETLRTENPGIVRVQETVEPTHVWLRFGTSSEDWDAGEWLECTFLPRDLDSDERLAVKLDRARLGIAQSWESNA
jgi:hypothetical protein